MEPHGARAVCLPFVSRAQLLTRPGGKSTWRYRQLADAVAGILHDDERT
jgi:hypothetical protein